MSSAIAYEELAVKALSDRPISKDEKEYKVEYVNSLGIYHYKKRNYVSAVLYLEQAMKECEGTSVDYVSLLHNIISSYNSMGRYEDAIKAGIPFYEKWHKKEKSLLARIRGFLPFLEVFAKSYLRQGDDLLYIRICQEIIDLAKYKNDKKYLGRGLVFLSSGYNRIGEYDKGIKIGEEALRIIEEAEGKSYYYFGALNSLSLNYKDKEDYTNAVRCFSEACDIIDVLDDSPLELAIFCGNHASLLGEIGEFEDAVHYYKESLALTRKYIGENNADYIVNLQNLACCYLDYGKNDSAFYFGEKSKELTQKTYGKQHVLYQEALILLIYSSYRANNLQEMSEYMSEYVCLAKNSILNSFSYLTKTEREVFWSEYSYALTGLLNTTAHYTCDDKIYSIAYEGALLSKGLLLNTEIELNKVILESNDKNLIDLYQTFVENKKMLSKLFELPVSERNCDVDSLQNVIHLQELQLIKDSKSYGDYMRKFKIGWKDVRNKLTKDDVAIEFISFEDSKKSTIYAALILKYDYEYPKFIELCTQTQLDNISLDSIYLTDSLYCYIWEPIKNELYGIRNIYFSPYGSLHKIGIEYLPMRDKQIISNKFNLYRLSSTREIVFAKESTKFEDAILYGGLKYDDNTDSVNQERGGVGFLEGTMVEVEAVDISLQDANINVTTKTAHEGTEESFKAISGQKVDLLHVATHGFYWTPSQADRLSAMNFLKGLKNIKNKEDKALTRSGLLMSGANYTLKHKANPNSLEDEILTAKEIAQLDFRKVDMVVLSACQTGLGEVSGDGVFGLQRGFKKAGVKTLVMSLWKVHDEATLVLMSEFYNNLTTGQSKHIALKNAQRYLREYDGGRFNNPKFWAAFIELDALN